jgi:DNA-binding transcriptional ArsR family regulator
MPPGELDIRRRIVRLVREYPGLHVREVARRLETSVALVEYHLPPLLESGLLQEQRDERYQRLFAPGPGTPDAQARRALGLLRARIPLQVTLHLLENGPSKHGQMAEALGLGKSKLSFHLRKLEGAGLVRKEADGQFALTDPKGTERLLLQHGPTPELKEEFADLWLGLYDHG